MKHSLPPPGGDLSFENIFLNTFGVFIGQYVNMAPYIFTFFNILWPRLRAMSCWSFYLQYLGDVCHEQMLSGWSLHEGSLLIRCGMRKKVVSRWRVELNQENEKWLIFAIKCRNVISWTPKNTIKMEARHLRSVIVNLKIRRTFTSCAYHSGWDRWCEVNTWHGACMLLCVLCLGSCSTETYTAERKYKIRGENMATFSRFKSLGPRST